MSYRMECLEFLAKMSQKLIERSPIKYKLVRALSCLSPAMILNNHVLSQKRMETLLQCLHDSNNISAEVADKAKGQFLKLCSNVSDELHSVFSTFSKTDDRLDKFYSDLLAKDNDSIELWTVVKLVLIMSHGNASVESGFSINSSILVENMLEEHRELCTTLYRLLVGC
jgi:hypothetical protein